MKINPISQISPKRSLNRQIIPVLIEKGEDGFYVVECPLFSGCYSQGETIDKALKNIREVIQLVLEEKENQEILNRYNPQEVSLHTITI